MLPRLGIEDIARYSQELGLELTPAEMRSMQSRLLEHIATFETFQELRIEEQRLPLRYTDRDPGYRPTAEEDPLNAFIRKCRIKGATIVGKMNMEDFSFGGPGLSGVGEGWTPHRPANRPDAGRPAFP